MKMDFLLAGVGGQGVLTASDIVAEVGVILGYDTKKSEIHGFSQRGGAVESHVRWGDRVAAPLSEKGSIDYLVAFELMESARWIDYVRPGGVAIVNCHRILPMTVTAGSAVYPTDEEIDTLLTTFTDRVIYVDGLAGAQKLGNKNLANSVLLGVLAKELGSDPEVWIRVLSKRVPHWYIEQNKQAFLNGMKTQPMAKIPGSVQP